MAQVVFISYDATSLPTPALLGVGVKTVTTSRDEDGNVTHTYSHVPPSGLTSLQVTTDELVNGTDSDAYVIEDDGSGGVQISVDAAKRQQELDERAAKEALQEKKFQRINRAQQRLLNLLDKAENRGIKTPQDAIDFVDANVNNLRQSNIVVGRLFFLVLELARHELPQNSEIFPGDE